MNKLNKVLCIIAGLFFLANDAFPQNECIIENTANLTVVCRALLGPTRCVAVQGNYAYVGTSTAFLIFDVTQKEHPQLIYKEYLCGEIIDIAVSGNYAYTLGAGNHIFDISDPFNAQRLEAVISAEFGYSLQIDGDYLFITNHWEALLQIYDISNPSELILVGTFQPLYSEPHTEDICINGNLAYVVYTPYSGLYSTDISLNSTIPNLKIVDISDKTAPKEIGSYYSGGDILGVALYQNYVYLVGDIRTGLQIVDVTDPTTPQFAGLLQYSASSSPQDRILVSGNTLFLLKSDSLKIFDISNPASPKMLSSLTGTHSGLCISEKFLYLAEGNRGLQIYDISNPEMPVFSGGYHSNGADRIFVKGDYAYTGNGELQILDVSNPHNLFNIGTIPFTIYHRWENLDVKNDILFIGCRHSKYPTQGLYVYDISNPEEPRQINYIDSFEVENALEIENESAFILTDSLLIILNISDPENINETGKYNLKDYARDLIIQNNYAFILCQKRGIVVLDVSSHTKIKEVNNWQSKLILSLFIRNNYLYCIGLEQLEIFDISDIYHPVFAGSFDYPIGYAFFGHSRIFMMQNSIYMVINRGLWVLDVSNPDSIHEIGIFSTSTRPTNVSLKDGYIYLANGDAGLYILKHDTTADIEIQRQYGASETFQLFRNYPNPFNSNTIISYQTKKSGHVALIVYDLMGKKVKILVNSEQNPGMHQIQWNGTDNDGNEVASGIYFYKLKTGGSYKSQGMILTK